MKETYSLINEKEKHYLLVQLSPVSSGNWFQEPPWIPKSSDTQVSYIKWCSTMNTVRPLYLWVLHPRIQRIGDQNFNSQLVESLLVESLDVKLKDEG